MTASRLLQSRLLRAIPSNASLIVTRNYSFTAAPSLPMKAGTTLDSIAVFKGKDPPVVKGREEYPDWVGKLAEPLPSLAKLRRIPNEEADDKDILRFLKLNRRIRIRQQNEETAN